MEATAAAPTRGEEGEEGWGNLPPNLLNGKWVPGCCDAERYTWPAGASRGGRGDAATEENGPNNWKREERQLLSGHSLCLDEAEFIS